MEQFDSSVEESFKVSEQQQRNDEQQCPNCAAELIEASVWISYERVRINILESLRGLVRFNISPNTL